MIAARFSRGSSTGSAGVAWRDLPECYGPWQTVWERHCAWARDGALDAVHRALMARASERGGLDWGVGVDSGTGVWVVRRASPECSAGPRR